ncbi:transforming growth factor beta regulator 1 [Modicella reniformis]|uniref:Transforming growth factor beta regulator 1 n=1 Tax=Modicella reniformis TaxID=1440133 RepID=A0A9P6IM10_9FUNG|nr:transforming growth factor beta regulator 1 [Modicella reniformis]
MDDISDFDDEDEDELKEEGLGDQRHGRFITKRTETTVDRRTLAGKSRRDASSDHGAQLPLEYMDTAGPSSGTFNGSSLHQNINDHISHSSGGNSSSSSGGGDASTSLVKTMPTVKKEKPDGAPKQTRRATASVSFDPRRGLNEQKRTQTQFCQSLTTLYLICHQPSTTQKRADRGRPRAVVPLPTNSDGSLNYPIVVGKGTNEVIIESMGRIVWQGRGYHNHRYIFPVGFRSKKQYTSLSDTSKKTYFINEILDGGEHPIFQITLEDMPEKVFRHTSSSGAWELALKGLMELGYNAKTHASGPDMYGLTNLGVIKYIQEMPNAHRCRRRKKINNSLYASNHEVLMETLEEESKAGSASSSRPYTPRKYTKRKMITTTNPGPETAADANRSSPISPLLPSAPTSEPGSGIQHSPMASTPIMTTPTAAPVTPVTPRSLTGQELSYPNVPEMLTPTQVQMRDDFQDKTSLHQYGHPFGQPLMEP